MFIFDAKYRLDGGNSDEIPGPGEETINTMHRYRDAVLEQLQQKKNDDNDGIVGEAEGPETYRRTVVGAFVLFPYRNEEKFAEKSPHYASIERVNVGAFPFMPRSDHLLTSFLKDIVEESFHSGYERNILPRGREDYVREKDFRRNVLVGNLGSKEQLDFILESNDPIYHIPCSEIRPGRYHLEYVAIYQSKIRFGEEKCGIHYFWEIKGMEVKKRKDIPFGNRDSDRLYYVFHLKNRNDDLASSPIRPRGSSNVRGSHIYTSDILLQRAKVIPDLYIKTWSGWRVWVEFRRLAEDLRVRDKTGEGYAGVDGFSVEGVEVEVADGELRTADGGRAWNLSEVTRNMRGVFKELMEEDSF